ncbi:hypothetical protein ACFE04_029410 [Oxalis oulophora]
MKQVEFQAVAQSQAPVWRSLLGFAHSMALKCAVELKLADIIHSHATPITISQIASSIDSPSTPDESSLKRVMRLLVEDQIFTSYEPSDGGETLYGSTEASSWIVNNKETSLSSFIIAQTHSSMMTGWSYLSQGVKEGGTGFEKAYNCNLYEFASKDQEFNKIFNSGMACMAKDLTAAIVEQYHDGFKGINTLVDVGGGIGKTIAAIVEANPHIKGINFDLSHVLAMAPKYNGVTHIVGNMFESIPKADAIFMKWIMHNWSDDECIKILKNCQKALSKRSGKVIIADMVLDPSNTNPFRERHIVGDLRMLAINRGKERTEPEWKRLLKEGGFPRYKIIEVAPTLCIVEAYME